MKTKMTNKAMILNSPKKGSVGLARQMIVSLFQQN